MITKLLIPQDTPPLGLPDLAIMRETARLVLGPDSGPDTLPPAAEELDTLTATLRGHLQLLTPEVEQAAGRLPENSPTRSGAMYCVGEARGKLRAPELSFARLSGSVMYARRLARVLVALCEHYEIVSAGMTETPEQTAFVRLAEHCLTCPTCKAMDDKGANLGLPCEEEERLNEEYRQARIRASAARIARQVRPVEATA
ncbi:DUF6415 family natural product biosynthesis protein [Streptomyces swartbergensis]|uniref:Uncharacterized protein n=1 Tax=Streptomyces swartbergensis TaxID=487165 RepID=A0A243RXZ1_9ACTN|nr:DUF6415 family natural product biosynthesis protein [Streptomyces swartbergensis]OUD00006.1 hypothetical protein CA983_27280 [Streptomyces swartbergensis]